MARLFWNYIDLDRAARAAREWRNPMSRWRDLTSGASACVGKITPVNSANTGTPLPCLPQPGRDHARALARGDPAL